MRTIVRRLAASVGAAALASASLAATALPAQASDPWTYTANTNQGSISIALSDTTAAPGDAITAEVTFVSTTSSTFTAEARLFSPTIPAGGYLHNFEPCTDVDPAVTECQRVPGTGLNVVSAPVAPGATVKATINLTVNPDAAPSSYNLSGVGRFNGTPYQLTPTRLFTVTAPAEADLGVDLSATAGPLLGSQITYDLDVSNAGPGDASASGVEIDLPQKVYSVANLPAACAYDSSTDVVTCDTGAITNGDTSSLSFKANIALLAIGSLNATATRVSSSPDDPNPANDTSTAHCGSLTGLIITC
ncbi:hypothetical protein [Isoptericola aurantiacus]|uniref:hypothetical protein n=1 Tax=Isoptericola aurantiacus TaxID=3377839 RepID=UPI00383BB698